MNIQTIANKLSNKHEDRTKHASTLRIKRENAYQLSNKQIKDEVWDIDLEEK